jgi:ribosomal protein L11 methylase PrmA
MPNLDLYNTDTLYATHGLQSYAAKCPPRLVRYGLSYYSKPGQLVLDPMMGSGTTLVEARLMSRNAIGFDIDPIAVLMSTVKSYPLQDLEIENAYQAVLAKYSRDVANLESPSAR